MSQPKCELCAVQSNLSVHEIPLSGDSEFQNRVQLCETCLSRLESPEADNARHWHCLHESIWSENPAVKVLAWRILNKLTAERWAQDLLDQIYLEDDLLRWARAESLDAASATPTAQTRDSNGTVLNDGDSVTLIKDLDVKGANFTAKRGTLVKNIVLTDDPGLIEGRVNGTQIVLKTCFLKRAN